MSEKINFQPDLFVAGDFTAHSGKVLPFKIDCDALSDVDLSTCAFLISELVPPFSDVQGVPRGGLRIAKALEPFAVEDAGLLIVDDVWTTGGSMREYRGDVDAYGAVIFARGPLDDWVSSLFNLNASFYV